LNNSRNMINGTDETGFHYYEDRVNSVVQSIGQGMKVFSVPMPWGDATISAGPYMDFPHDDSIYFGIKCAREIDMPYSVAVDIPDFKTPDPVEAESAVWLAIAASRVGLTPYFGCMGGLGRTGTMLGILAKVGLSTAPRRILGLRLPFSRGGDPVDWVRKNYRVAAIETTEQEVFVREFDVRWLVKMTRSLR